MNDLTTFTNPEFGQVRTSEEARLEAMRQCVLGMLEDMLGPEWAAAALPAANKEG